MSAQMPDTQTDPNTGIIEQDYERKPVQPAQAKKLKALGWTTKDINSFDRQIASAKIKAKEYKPGSAAFMRNARNPLTGTKGVPGADRYSDEAIAKRNETKADPSGVGVITDEFTQQCLRGEDPIDDALKFYDERNPGKRFRFLNPGLELGNGGFQMVRQQEGAPPVEQRGLVLGWMPESLYDEIHRKPQQARSAAQLKSLQKPASGDAKEVMVNGQVQMEAGGDLRLRGAAARGMNKLAHFDNCELNMEESSFQH